MSVRSHCTDMELLDPSDALAQESAEHLDACPDCRIRRFTLQTFATDFLADRDIHLHALRNYPPPQPTDLRDAISEVVRGNAAYAHAQAAFTTFSEKPVEEWVTYLFAQPDLVTDGMVRRLIEAGQEELEIHPARALAILDVATTVANVLDDVFQLAEQRGNVEKERANALRLLNRYPEALEALDTATRFLSQLAAPDYDLVFIEWSRATVLFAASRFVEALPIVERVIRTFRRFGESRYARQAQLLVANIVCDQGDVAAARDMYLELLTYFAGLADREYVARLHANLAECAARLDNAEEAHRYAQSAVEAYRELRKPTEIVRVRWTLAYLLLRQGRYDEALPELAEAITQFETHGVASAAAEAGLDILEIHIVREEWAEAEVLARYLADIFVRAQAPVHQTRALADLREAVIGHTATRELVSDVRIRVASVSDDALPS